MGENLLLARAALDAFFPQHQRQKRVGEEQQSRTRKALLPFHASNEGLVSFAKSFCFGHERHLVICSNSSRENVRLTLQSPDFDAFFVSTSFSSVHVLLSKWHQFRPNRRKQIRGDDCSKRYLVCLFMAVLLVFVS